MSPEVRGGGAAWRESATERATASSLFSSRKKRKKERERSEEGDVGLGLLNRWV